ncbi:DUF4906 domain-containing protein [uncultured Bacteroides sp.]|uniref:DUF4906 domain-containing protein n=1 Tax=uncultured Bacteroides sp. TaxID=162156 RepID=UPI0025D2B8AF|nr:DUF4906 domain-containing protein [uncultured Bacteroides sp.]
MKHILNILFIIIAITSCTVEDEEDIRYDSADIDYTFRVAVDGRTVTTRSLAGSTDENSLYDLNAFIFDAATGQAISFKYFAPSEMSNLSIPMRISGSSGSRIFAFIANAGSSIGSTVTKLADLNNLKKTMTSGTDFLSGGRVVMSALTDTKVINITPGTTSGTYALGVINLERLTAKVTVVIDKSALEASTLVTVRSIQLKNVPMVYSYIAPNAPTTSTTTFVNGDNITVNDGNLEPVDPTGNNLPHNYATPLYMVENMQGTRALPTNVPGEECTSSKTQIPLLPAQCSYIEVVCEYRTTLPAGERDGLVTYRVYLGLNLNGTNWNNFDVKRNTWYQATLTLTGRGGADEVSWRIVTDLVTHNGQDYPWGKGGFAYTIDPSDSRFWSIESPYQNTLVTFASSNANLHPDSEYSEGRGVTYLNGTAQNITAIRQCWRLNGENGITLNAVTKTKYYLPSQNQLQMISIYFNARSYPAGLFWSSTQLVTGTSNSNQYARAISYTNYGEAQTYTSISTQGYPRCLMEPDRTYQFPVAGVSTSSTPVYYPLQTAPNIKTYPYFQSGSLPVIVNQELWNYGGSIGFQPRGVVSISLRTGAPYDGLTANYHTVRKPYTLIRVAKNDCDKNGNPVVNNALVRSTMNWYEALGYVTPSGADPATPTINTTRTGCNAYSERSDKKDLGTWRVPTSLELTQLWVMGAGVGGDTPVNPNYTYAVAGTGTNVVISTPRYPRMSEQYPGVASLWGDVSTLTNNITNINYVWPGGTATTPYDLSKLYWSSNTSPNTTPANAFAMMLDFYSGDSYTGSGPRTAGFPRKKGQGLLRCVKDVTETTRYQQ